MQAEGEEEVICVVLTDERKQRARVLSGYGSPLLMMTIPRTGSDGRLRCCEDDGCDFHEHDEEEDTAAIARMDFDENGEAVYTAPA